MTCSEREPVAELGLELRRFWLHVSYSDRWTTADSQQEVPKILKMCEILLRLKPHINDGYPFYCRTGYVAVLHRYWTVASKQILLDSCLSCCVAIKELFISDVWYLLESDVVIEGRGFFLKYGLKKCLKYYILALNIISLLSGGNGSILSFLFRWTISLNWKSPFDMILKIH